MMPPIDELHPLLVHFPIALYSTAVLWEFIGFIRRSNSLLTVGWWNMVLAQIAVVFTIITGFIADSLMGHMDKPFPIFTTHGSLQLVAVVWFGVAFIFRWKKLKNLSDTNSFPWGYLLFLGMGVLILFYGSHLGAKLANRI